MAFDWRIVLVFWTAIGVFAVIQSYIHYTIHEKEFVGVLSVSRLLLEIIPGWYFWAFATPLIFKLGAGFSFEQRAGRLTAVFIHVVSSLVFASAYMLVNAVFLSLARDSSLTAEAVISTFTSRTVSGSYFAFLTYWAILGAGFAVNYYRRFREREVEAAHLATRSSQLETELIKAQLSALKAQIQPHFLFNTLHAVSALMQDDVKRARSMIAKLSEILRITIDEAHEHKIPISRELDVLNLYLDIEKMRFGSHLTINIELHEGASDVLVPSFILQPLVENAIKHGVGRSGKGSLEITAVRRNGNLEIRVLDDGPGPIANAATYGHGLGFKNTKDRLERLYGPAGRLELDRLGNKTVATLTMPAETGQYANYSS